MKKIGKVTAEEKQEIQHLFERRNALKELAKILRSGNFKIIINGEVQ